RSGRRTRAVSAGADVERIAASRMNMHKRLAYAVAVVVLLAAGCSGSSGPSGTSAGGRLTIAMIPKGTSHVFWQMVHGGGEKAAQELGIDLVWRGPLREDDRESQVTEVENATARGVAGIALAPLDEAALVGPVSTAMKQKIPV